MKKYKKFKRNFSDDYSYVVYIKNLQQALNHGSKFNNLQRVFPLTKFGQNHYLELHTKLRKKATKIMNNAVAGNHRQSGI